MPKSLMILGTSSGAGKSTVATGICRILYKDGYSVAPFKSQNMSNNGHRLENGLEMARSQAIQAYACEIQPHPDMNPILLKILPEGIEVIISGNSVGTMSSAEYIRLKKDIWSKILEPFERLRQNHQIVVLEGAGSPVEMNLKEHDIVNISMAQKANSPVLLVADIDRGGVFASVYGTLMLLSESERSLVKGIIINRLRGEKEHFHEVKTVMEKITGIPVVGMIPYMKLEIEDEDGLIDPQTGVKPPQSTWEMEKQFDLLARNMREHLDMVKLYEIIKKGLSEI